MKMTILTVMACSAISTLAMASGSPEINCTTADGQYSIYMQLGRTDEDLSDVIDRSTENDMYGIVTPDTSDYASLQIGSKAGAATGKTDGNDVAEIVLAEGTTGFLSQTQIATKTVVVAGKKKTLTKNSNVFLLESSKKDSYSIRILATNKANLDKEEMSGLMTLEILSTTDKIKKTLKLQAVKVTCTGGWG